MEKEEKQKENKKFSFGCTAKSVVVVWDQPFQLVKLRELLAWLARTRTVVVHA